ncbi:hypothetical protein WDU94_001018 [Cyamophila willieti]
MKPVPSKWKPKEDPVLGYHDNDHYDSRNITTSKRDIRRPMYIEDYQDSFTPLSTLRHSPSFITKLTYATSQDKLSPKTPRRSVPANKSRRSSSPCIARQNGDGKETRRRASDSKQPPAHDNKEPQRRKRTSDEESKARLGRENTVPSKSPLGKGKEKQVRERWAGWETEAVEGKRSNVEESRRRVHFELPVHVRPRKGALRSGGALTREYFSSSRRPLAPATGRVYNTAVALLRAAKDNEEELLYQVLAAENLVESEDVNICDHTGREAS